MAPSEDTVKGTAISGGQSSLKQLEDQLKSVNNAFEDGLRAASHALKQSTVTARDEATKAAGMLQVAYDHFFMFLDMADQYVVSTMKDGIVYGLEHRVTVATVGASAMVVLLPGVRRSLWRATFGRFTSPEQMVETCEGSIKLMVADLQAQKGEIAKLSERLQVAREQYASGLTKLRHAASEMRSLESRVQASENKAKDLLYEIRNIRSNQALQLRSDAAVVVESAKRQRHQVEKIVGKLDSHGL